MNNNALRRPSLRASDSTRRGRHYARGGAPFAPRASLPDHHIFGSVQRVGTVRARAVSVVNFEFVRGRKFEEIGCLH